MSATTAERRAAARNLARVKKLSDYLARAEAAGRGDTPMAESARQQIAQRLVGRCRECHRELTDPDSIAAGIGPECASR
jgi:hypothetical protein